MRFFLPAAALAVAVLAGCDNDPLGNGTDTPTASRVLVVNQGNFSQGNGTLTSYVPGTQAVTQSAADFASTLQSAYAWNNRVYVLADKAGRLDVLTAALVREGASVAGLHSARYAAATTSQLFVSSITDTLGGFAGGSLTVLNPATRQIVKRVPLAAAAEGVATAAGGVFVALHGFGAGRDVALVNASAYGVTTLAGVCDGPRSLFTDSTADVNVFCTGSTTYDANFNVTGQTNGSLVVLDGATGAVKTRVDLGAPAGAVNSGQDGSYDASSGTLYFVQGRTVRTFNTVTNALGAAVVTATQDIGAVAYDASRRQLHVALYPVSNPFTTSGSVAVFTVANGVATAFTTYTAGIAPTFIAFQ